MVSRSNLDPAQLFDPRYLESGGLPAGLSLHLRQIIFLWQPPSSTTIRRLQQRYPRVPILVGRFDAETPIYQAGLRYWSPADFFPLSVLLDLELASHKARADWSGPQQPDYEGMPLVDGDFPRIRFWSEMVASAAMFMVLARVLPDVQVITDWMGAQLAHACGLRVQRLLLADISDHNWPPRRELREYWARATKRNPVQDRTEPADVVFLLGGWVAPRLLATFPVEPLAQAGHQCSIWVHQTSAALESLLARTGSSCRQLEYPDPVSNIRPLQQRVETWCDTAIEGGYFAPLRGRLARTVVGMMNWPRWTPRLVAMHRLLSTLLRDASPRLIIAPAEKDWTSYCGHHVARQLAIPSIGMKHSTWPTGSGLQNMDDAYCFPSPAKHLLAYTPMEAQLRVSKPMTIWRGNPRLEKPQRVAEAGNSPDGSRLLICARGVGPGRAMFLRNAVFPFNQRLIRAFHERFGDRVRVRLHPWDAIDNYPAEIRPLVLPDESLDAQLARFAAVITTYSTVAFDASAAGLPLFIWDHERFNLDRSELMQSGTVVATDLFELVDAAARFFNQADYRQILVQRAAHHANQLHNSDSTLADWLSSVMHATLPAKPVMDNVPQLVG
jgi:hypothetical protein